jgi:hypothetical protein
MKLTTSRLQTKAINTITMDDMLYHVKRTIVDFKNDATGALQKVDIRGTYTDLTNAKAAAKNALFDEGYEKDWFTIFDTHDTTEGWKHGDGTFVFAQTIDGETFTVALETTPNTLGLKGNPDGKVEDKLFHILQTTIHYNIDRSGASRDTSLEGTYKTFEDAKNMALTCLIGDDVKKDSFVEFDEFSGQEDWAYGENVMVHAVGIGGENYLVAVISSL